MYFAFSSLTVRYGRRAILDNSNEACRKDLLFCGRHLDAMLWQPPCERVCEACEAKRSPIPKLRRIHMSFALRDRWYCTFMEEDLRTPAAPGRSFTSADKYGRDDSTG
jgi:hypothetical protein